MKKINEFWSLPHKDCRKMIENHIRKTDPKFDWVYSERLHMNYDLETLSFDEGHKDGLVAWYFAPHIPGDYGYVYIKDLLNVGNVEMVLYALLMMDKNPRIPSPVIIGNHKAFNYNDVAGYMEARDIKLDGKTPENSVSSALSKMEKEGILYRTIYQKKYYYYLVD